MIATVTLNPAVDKTLTTSMAILGAVNRADSVVNVPGGKGINVAKVLKTFGYDVKALGFLGGYTGQKIEEYANEIGIKCCFTHIKGESRTSINVVSADGYVTEFLEPGPAISQEEIDAFLDNYRKEIEECDIVVLSGSTPVGIPSTFYADLISIASKMDKKVLLDSSGDNLKKGMYARPFMIKPNMKELESLMGRRLQGMQGVAIAATQIVEWGVPNVLVSMGKKGIVYAKEGEKAPEVYYVPAPSVKAVNTVGSGDSAVAAFAMAIEKGLSPEETVKKCVAVSVANVLSIENGIISMASVHEIESKLQLASTFVS